MATINSILNKAVDLTITDNADITKEVSFVVSNVTTGTTRTLTIDDRNVDFDAVPTSITTESGTCTPAAGVFSILGTDLLSTSATGSVVTVTDSRAAATAGFLTELTSDMTGIPSDYTEELVDYNSEIFDIGSDVSGGIFIAPQNGIYLLVATVYVDTLTSDMVDASIIINTSNLLYTRVINPYEAKASGTHTGITLQVSTIENMDMGDFAGVEISIGDYFFDDYDILGSVNGTFFSGWLLE